MRLNPKDLSALQAFNVAADYCTCYSGAIAPCEGSERLSDPGPAPAQGPPDDLASAAKAHSRSHIVAAQWPVVL